MASYKVQAPGFSNCDNPGYLPAATPESQVRADDCGNYPAGSVSAENDACYPVGSSCYLAEACSDRDSVCPTGSSCYPAEADGQGGSSYLAPAGADGDACYPAGSPGYLAGATSKSPVESFSYGGSSDRHTDSPIIFFL